MVKGFAVLFKNILAALAFTQRKIKESPAHISHSLNFGMVLKETKTHAKI
jgi:hypothetical protein